MDYVEQRIHRQSNMSGPEEMPPKEMEFRVPADGVIPLHIQLMNETERLTIDVRLYIKVSKP